MTCEQNIQEQMAVSTIAAQWRSQETGRSL